MDAIKKILVVDDEPTVLKSVSLILESKGCSVEQSRSGLEAITLLENDPDLFDCIVLDYSMPKMNGLTALQKIRELGTSTPVILCSGLSFAHDESEKHKHWPQEILTKPFQLNQLIESISRACNPK